MIARKVRSVSRRVVHELYCSIYDRPPGDHVVVLLTIPRSGSTWSMDLMRTHPQIELHPRYYVHTALGLHGRRYPRDLSNGAGASLTIEVEPRQWEKIPDVSWPQTDVEGQKQFDLEKIHPHFFEHDVDQFVSRVNEFSKKRPLTMLYQIRDPRETLVSFLQYKKRNPSWDGRSLEEISQHVQRIFESIRAVHKRLPGLIVDYQELRQSPGHVLSDLLSEVTGRKPTDDEIEQSLHETRREKKQTKTSGFVGKTRSEDLTDHYEDYFAKHESAIKAMYAAYESLRQ